MQVIPLQAVPSQTLAVVLGGQTVNLDVLTREAGDVTFMCVNVYVDQVLIVGSVLARDRVRMVRDTYLGFVGDLAFFDMAGASDPEYAGLGTRWFLAYLEVGDY